MGLLDTKYEGVRGRDCGGGAGGEGRPWAGGGVFQASGQPLPAQSEGGFTGVVLFPPSPGVCGRWL